jgi:adenylosuccinate synthase
MITDTTVYANSMLDQGKNILVEGANATSKFCITVITSPIPPSPDLLRPVYATFLYMPVIDLDFGTFPYVTSSNPSVGSVMSGLGVSPHYVQEVCGIVKAYCTRVGEGPFPTELSGELEIKLRTVGHVRVL